MFRSPKAHLSTTEKLKGENKRPETSDDEQAPDQRLSVEERFYKWKFSDNLVLEE